MDQERKEFVVSMVGTFCSNMMWFDLDELLELREMFQVDPATGLCFDAFIALRAAVPGALEVANAALEEMEL